MPNKIQRFRFFGGSKYRFYINYIKKTDAKRNAKRIRDQSGMNARIHKHSGGYAVYIK